VFVPLTEYPFDEWQRKRGRSGEHAVELTIPGAVPDIVEYVQRVELRQAGDPAVVVVDTSDRRDTWR
jgi:hypothetical protein